MSKNAKISRMFRNLTRMKKYRFYRLINTNPLDIVCNLRVKENFKKIKKIFKKKEKISKEKESLTVYEYYVKKRKAKLIILVLLFSLFIGILIGVSYLSVRLING